MRPSRASVVFAVCILLVSGLLPSGKLLAAPVTPLPEGTTTLTFSDELLSVLSGGGVRIDAIGEATLTGPPLAAEFPITSGFERGDSFLLSHRDSGLEFSSEPDVALFISDFTVIGNDTGSRVFGQAFGEDEGRTFSFVCCVPLFNIDSESTVTFTNVSAFGFSRLFDLDFATLRATEVGKASIQFVPIPPAFLLFGSALVGLAFIGRRKIA